MMNNPYIMIEESHRGRLQCDLCDFSLIVDCYDSTRVSRFVKHGASSSMSR